MIDVLFQILLSTRRPSIKDSALTEENLRQWNDLMDEAFHKPTEFFDDSTMENDPFSVECSIIFARLKAVFLAFLFNKEVKKLEHLYSCSNYATGDEDSPGIEPRAIESTMRRVQATRRLDVPTSLDIELIRCVQNLMRWYIQIVLPVRQRQQQELVDALKPWKDISMLTLILDLMEIRGLGRFPSQLFFFATFTALPHDQDLMNAMQSLVDQHDLADRLLTILSETSLAEERWLLSLARNVHNAVGGFQEQCLRKFEEASVVVESPWSLTSGNRQTYASALRELGIAVLKNKDRPSLISHELVVEILRCCFALRLGSKLLDERWRLFVEECLTNENKLCQNAAVSILVDAPAQYSLNPTTMLRIINRQLGDTDGGLIDDSDAAEIIPILAVLHKFCVANPEFRRSMHAGIFNEEEKYQLALKREIEKNKDLPARNARPLDSPKGSLRSNLIRLMSCPHSIVKRLAGELLWSMLNCDRDEFVRRVGLGNALPFLSAKGLARIPG